MATLIGSVGQGGKNIRTDVASVQSLINQCMQYLVPLRYLQTAGRCNDDTIDAIRQFQKRVMKVMQPDGRVDPRGRTLVALNTCASGQTYTPTPPPNAGLQGGKYTDSPNEVVTTRTTPTARDVVSLLRSSWPELTEEGARTLTAQFMTETTDGSHCYNWNLGNVKASSTTVLHMYLRNVWEGLSPSAGQALIDKSNGLARFATADEIKKHGWGVPSGKSVVVFQPPHPAARFRAYTTLSEGAQRWMGLHKAIAAKVGDYLATLNAGDCAGVAKRLADPPVRYYTGSEPNYAKSMKDKKAAIDKSLGSV